MPDNLSGDYILVKRLINGNYIAFNSLYEKYSYAVFRFAFGYVKSKTEAEEIVQDVFMTIWDKRINLNPGLSFKSYVFTIAFHCVLKYFRTKEHLTKYINGVLSENSFKPELQEINYDFLCQYIKKISENLPPRCKEVFIKSRLEDQSIHEIAREMEISHKTVENQLTYALKFIRQKLIKEL